MVDSTSRWRIVVACDHAGLDMKERVIAYLKKTGQEIRDGGVHTAERVDYPDVVDEAVRSFREEKQDFLILICGTGIGMSIAANKYQGIYCALLNSVYAAQMARQHNHANCLALPARAPTAESIEEILHGFFSMVPEGGRHQERVEKIKNWENHNCKG